MTDIDKPEQTAVNDSGTSAAADTRLTRDRSRFGLTGLRGLRDKHGPHSAIGYRVSNIEEMFDNLPPGPDDRIGYLMPDSEKVRYETIMKSIRKQTAELAGLLTV
jgi:hypothetical protein